MDKLTQIYHMHDAAAMIKLRLRLYLLKNERFKSLKQLFSEHEEILRELASTGC